MALCLRVVSLWPLVIHIYSGKRTRVTYPNENLGSGSDVFLTRKFDVDKRVRVSLESFDIQGSEGQSVSSDRRTSKLCFQRMAVGSTYLLISRHLLACFLNQRACIWVLPRKQVNYDN